MRGLSRFVIFRATGIKYKRGAEGKISGVEKYRTGSGVVKVSKAMQGQVFRQCRQLLDCDRIKIYTQAI